MDVEAAVSLDVDRLRRRRERDAAPARERGQAAQITRRMQAGLVREVAVEGRAGRFDLEGTRHHHFICDRCGNVEDVEWYDVPKPASRSLGKRIVRECQLIFRGLCTKCARKPASR